MEKKNNYVKINNKYICLNNIFQIIIDPEENQIIFSYNKQEDFKKIIIDYTEEQYYFINKTLNNWFLTKENIIQKFINIINKLKEKKEKNER